MRRAMKRPRALLLCAVMTAALAGGAGCLRVYTRAGGIEPSARPIGERQFEVLDRVEAQSSAFRLLWFFPVTPPADLGAAIDQAMGKKTGDNLIDLRWWHERQVWILGTVDIVHVRGTVVRFKAGP
jgi:hypothetical protein